MLQLGSNHSFQQEKKLFFMPCNAKGEDQGRGEKSHPFTLFNLVDNELRIFLTKIFRLHRLLRFQRREQKETVYYYPGNECSRCRNPQIFGTSPFATAEFEAFSTMCTELSFIEQRTAPADPNFQRALLSAPDLKT